MTDGDLIERINNLNVWRRGDQRAPHKPLLLIWALARFNEGREEFPFLELEEPLRQLLDDFGPPRKSHHPEFPFWHLQSDGLWVLEGSEDLRIRKGSQSPTINSLRSVNPTGRLAPVVADTLHRFPALLPRIVQTLLDAHFPSSLHGDILDAAGLEFETTGLNPASVTLRRRQRDPGFREAVLRAYGYSCAVCGFNARLGNTLVGVDAAHVKWHQAVGPDEIPNGLALCALHHRLLDRGAFTISFSGTVQVAEAAHGGEGFESWLLRFHGSPLRLPVRISYTIAEPFIDWHHREVFRKPARLTS